jgi:hypothetical protein
MTSITHGNLAPNCRKFVAVQGPHPSTEKAGIDHILAAEQNGEINEENILYMVENVNAAGKPLCDAHKESRCPLFV